MSRNLPLLSLTLRVAYLSGLITCPEYNFNLMLEVRNLLHSCIDIKTEVG